ncbi:response regulator transcription factor [Paracoccus sp. (in: a-proteobacteria)]|uniref:response regulator transcription factor n=1 Tax=Paracoccus sp. TaxID=267 RepID=UPI003A8A3963
MILDDDTDFCEEISTFLGGYHIPVIVAHKPSEAERILANEKISMLLLDVMLPEKHGFKFCEETRSRMADLPILFVSAYCDSFEQVLGFEAGADHFLRKPFLPQELLARMKAILRRVGPGNRSGETAAVTGKLYTRAGLMIDLPLGQAFLHGERLKLTSFQFEMLVYFVQNSQRLITRNEVMTNVNFYNVELLSRSVDIHVSRLRKALGDRADEPHFVRTVWRKGYYFIDELVEGPSNAGYT